MVFDSNIINELVQRMRSSSLGYSSSVTILRSLIGLITPNRSLEELELTDLFLNVYRPIVLKNFLYNMFNMCTNFCEKQKFYESVNSEINKKFDELIQLLEMYCENVNKQDISSRERDVTKRLIKEMSKNIELSIEKALEKIGIITKKYEDQKFNSYLGLALNVIGIAFGLYIKDYKMVYGNIFFSVGDCISLADSHLSLKELNEQINLIDSKKSELEKLIDRIEKLK